MTDAPKGPAETPAPDAEEAEFSRLLEDLGREILENPIVLFADAPKPAEVAEVRVSKSAFLPAERHVGDLVSVRPVGGEKTYLGVMLGNLATGEATVAYSARDKRVQVLLDANPAIYVFELARIVRGRESWWGVIRSEEDLRRITDFDIENAWCVRALKALAARRGEGRGDAPPQPPGEHVPGAADAS